MTDRSLPTVASAAILSLTLMEYISYATIFLALFGTVGNILILVAFFKIGFAETINISYSALCVSDMLCVAGFTFNAICYIPAFFKSDIPFIAMEVVIPTGGGTSDMFSEITAWITAYISLERCLCVVFPLKVKTIVKRKRTIIVLSAIFSMAAIPLMSIKLYVYEFVEKFDVRRNTTLIGTRFRSSKFADALYDFYFMYKLVIMEIVPLIIVLVSSVTLAVHIRRIASWRAGNSGPPIEKSTNKDDRNHRKYTKDVRVAKTVLVIATAFIFLGTLKSVRFLSSVLWPPFGPLGAYDAQYKLISRIAFLLSLTNSSVNFVIYYKMGSKFRSTVDQMCLGLK
ncbi:hypothetical protein EGW08_000019 [Elysia chlorotica]|uniref:G-protein coupled receptors family 1 profile domain-containing protein n=1 Tax=Elysia chlorotica TaxID=188477 RepID=A0A433UEC6_ELYCH|nr:hypothetical protein EGW08_000019 [Elysia chlorotica]